MPAVRGRLSLQPSTISKNRITTLSCLIACALCVLNTVTASSEESALALSDVDSSPLSGLAPAERDAVDSLLNTVDALKQENYQAYYENQQFRKVLLSMSLGQASREDAVQVLNEVRSSSPEVTMRLLQTNTTACEPESSGGVQPMNIVFVIILLALSATFSGLTLGLMGLDIVGLDIVIASGAPIEQKYASKIKPLRKRGNLLLCTLLLGNTLVNAALAILMDSLFSGTVGLIVVTIAIVIIGEISPQAACSRFALKIGYYTIPIVWVFLVLMFPFSYPLSKVLDWVLGDEIGTIYTRSMLKKLLAIHTDHSGTSGLKKSEVAVLSGAIDFSQKVAKYAMTPLKDVFGIDFHAVFDYELRQKVVESGYSRIPVFENGPQKITQLLLVRDLLLLNPEDNTPISSMLPVYGRPILTTFDDVHLDDLLNTFKKAHCHMAIVHTVNSDGPGDPFYENVGLITLEDLFEELIQDEIVDETDVYVDVAADTKVRVGGVNRVSYKTLMKDKSGGSSLSDEQVLAISSYLAAIDPLFSPALISTDILQSLVRQQGVYSLEAEGEEDYPKLYQLGQASLHFTLVLAGKVKVKSGKDGFLSELGPWQTMGRDALSGEAFIPDFDARAASKQLEVWRLPRAEYQSALRATDLHNLIKTGHVTAESAEAASLAGSGRARADRSDPIDIASSLPAPAGSVRSGRAISGEAEDAGLYQTASSGTTARAAAELARGSNNSRVAELREGDDGALMPRLSVDSGAASIPDGDA